MIKIPVIDLFAGPGGLGEGFSSLEDEKGKRIFEIKLSIEKDENAHKTLRLRSFFRQFKKDEVPELYYSYIKENDIRIKNNLLSDIKKEYSKQWNHAEREAWCFELPYPEEISEKTKKQKGYSPIEIEQRHQEIDNKIKQRLENRKDWLLIGGPPCQAYSLVGRARNQGISVKDHRVFLYKEYLRIIAKHHPAVFVMENVKGLLSAKIGKQKVFDWIKKDLKDPGSIFQEYNSPRYKVFSFIKYPNGFDREGFPLYNNDKDFLIKTEKYSVPQRRHRVILLGIREDFNFNMFNTLDQKEEVKLKQVIDDLPELRSGIGREVTGENIKGNHIYSKIENNQANWEEAILSARKKLNYLFPERDKSHDIDFPYSQGKNFLPIKRKEKSNPLYKNWYYDSRLGGVLNHETRTHLKEDLMRYLFSALYLKQKGDFPKLRDYPVWLLPKHKNAKGDKFADRFRTQRPDQPATTITSHISKDGHYFIHYDSNQCRSLTVREAARIQTFPDNYYFCGPRTSQYHQVGNAVPPYLAKQVAEIVFNIYNK